MGKYSKQFKLSAINAYLERGQGFRHVAAQLQMDPTLLRRWVAAYELHDEASLLGRVKEHSPEFKLSVLQHMEREKLSFRQTAAVFNLGSSTQIGRWQQQYYSGGIEALTSGKKGPRNVMPKLPAKPRKPVLLTDEERAHKELLDELQFLRMENAYLKKLKVLGEEAIRRDKEAKKKPK
jgi:transposase